VDVKFELTEGEKCKRTLKITVSAEQVKEKFDAVYKELRAEAEIPGFRKGKAPLSTIRARYGKNAQKDVLEDLMDESYAEALKQSGLDPVSYPSISDVDFAEDKDLSYIAELEIRPDIKLEKYSGFALKRPDDQIKENEVDETLARIRRSNSSLQTVERPAEESEFVVADLKVISDSAGKLNDEEFSNVQLELVDGDVASQFKTQLLGISAGEERKVTIDYPQEHFDKRFAGSKVEFNVKAGAVKRLELVEMDKEFLKQFGENLETVDDFKKRIEEDIKRHKEKDSKDALRNEVIKEVIDKNRFDLPESLVQRFLDNVVADYRENHKEEFDEEQLRQNYRPVANRQLRWDFLYQEIANAENIKVEQQDIEVWLRQFADNYNMTIDEAKKSLQDNRRIADLKRTILENKVIDYIIENSTVEVERESNLIKQ
jgi:trigger factor